MKVQTTIIIICLLSILTPSCSIQNPESSADPEVIKIDIDDKNRDRLNISIEAVVTLEKSKNSLLSWISKVKYFNHRFYLLKKNRFQQPSLFVFDESGNFINKTSIGKGPGEVISPFSFTINKEDSIILLHDQVTNPTLVYDVDLNYIRSVKHDYIFMNDFQHISRDTFFVYHHIFRDIKEKDQYINYTLYTEGFTKYKHLDILFNKRSSIFFPINISNKEVLFIADWDYNIYQLVNGKEKIRYNLDFGKYSFTTKQLAALSREELDVYMSQGKLAVIVGLFKTDDFLIILTKFKEKLITFFQSIKNKEIYCLNDCIDSNLIPDCLIYGVMNNGTFYSKVGPEKLIEFQKSSGQLKNLKITEDDNPYLVLFKVKEK